MAVEYSVHCKSTTQIDGSLTAVAVIAAVGNNP